MSHDLSKKTSLVPFFSATKSPSYEQTKEELEQSSQSLTKLHCAGTYIFECLHVFVCQMVLGVPYCVRSVGILIYTDTVVERKAVFNQLDLMMLQVLRLAKTV